MAYGHAERALAAVRALEAGAAELLCRLPQADAERASWLNEVVAAGIVLVVADPGRCCLGPVRLRTAVARRPAC